MSAAVTTSKLELCKNLTIDFGQSSRAHHVVGVIWRTAAIICLIAAATFLTYLSIVYWSELAFNFEVLILFCSLNALTLLAFHSFWSAGTAEFAQSQFYQRVAEKEIELQTNWGKPEIKAFFAAHDIEFPKHAAVKQLLQTKVKEGEHFSNSFIPAIAHFKTLRTHRMPPDAPIPTLHCCLDQLNLAMILQSMHRPYENKWMKLDNRFTDTIPGVGKLDRIAVIKQISSGEDGPAFVFTHKKKHETLMIGELISYEPQEIRALIFDVPDPTLDEPD